MTPENRLSTLLDRGDFVVTAEITPRLTANGADFLEQAEPLKGRADAVNVTDGAGARVAMSSMAASSCHTSSWPLPTNTVTLVSVEGMMWAGKSPVTSLITYSPG